MGWLAHVSGRWGVGETFFPPTDAPATPCQRAFWSGPSFVEWTFVEWTFVIRGVVLREVVFGVFFSFFGDHKNQQLARKRLTVFHSHAAQAHKHSGKRSRHDAQAHRTQVRARVHAHPHTHAEVLASFSLGGDVCHSSRGVFFPTFLLMMFC